MSNMWTTALDAGVGTTAPAMMGARAKRVRWEDTRLRFGSMNKVRLIGPSGKPVKRGVQLITMHHEGRTHVVFTFQFTKSKHVVAVEAYSPAKKKYQRYSITPVKVKTGYQWAIRFDSSMIEC